MFAQLFEACGSEHVETIDCVTHPWKETTAIKTTEPGSGQLADIDEALTSLLSGDGGIPSDPSLDEFINGDDYWWEIPKSNPSEYLSRPHQNRNDPWSAEHLAAEANAFSWAIGATDLIDRDYSKVTLDPTTFHEPYGKRPDFEDPKFKPPISALTPLSRNQWSTLGTPEGTGTARSLQTRLQTQSPQNLPRDPKAQPAKSNDFISIDSVWYVPFTLAKSAQSDAAISNIRPPSRDELQSSHAFQNGTLDVSEIMAGLRTGARCTESGLVVGRVHAYAVMRKFGISRR